MSDALDVPDEYRLTVEIKNDAPVLLDDFTRSFGALADEYEIYISTRSPFEVTGDVKLYIREIRPGSIVADLIAQAPVGVALALPWIKNAKTVVEFAKYLGTAYEWLIGKTKEKPSLSKQEFENLSTILDPVAKDSSAQVNISGNHNQTVVHVININSLEANAAQNTTRREIESLREPLTRQHEKVLMYFYQARDDMRSDKGDRARIESISAQPVKVAFVDEHLKERAFDVEHGPFRSAYVVDVSVETINGRPALYRITAIHDIFDRPGNA